MRIYFKHLLAPFISTFYSLHPLFHSILATIKYQHLTYTCNKIYSHIVKILSKTHLAPSMSCKTRRGHRPWRRYPNVEIMSCRNPANILHTPFPSFNAIATDSIDSSSLATTSKLRPYLCGHLSSNVRQRHHDIISSSGGAQ